MKIHFFVMRAPKEWRTKPGEICISDPEGIGGKWKTAFIKIGRTFAVLPLWWRYRLIIHFGCPCR